MGFVSSAVQVNTIPAGREECLRTHALALLRREGIGVRHGIGVEADVRNGLVLKARGIESTGLMLELRREKII